MIIGIEIWRRSLNQLLYHDILAISILLMIYSFIFLMFYPNLFQCFNSLKTSENLWFPCFLTFSGGVEMEHGIKWVKLKSAVNHACIFVKYCYGEGLKQMHFGILMFIKTIVSPLLGKRSYISKWHNLLMFFWISYW